MLDLSFVRANLELVEAKLRDRGQDPAALLGDFRALDQDRRERITKVETLKAQRNKLSSEFGKIRQHETIGDTGVSAIEYYRGELLQMKEEIESLKEEIENSEDNA